MSSKAQTGKSTPQGKRREEPAGARLHDPGTEGRPRAVEPNRFVGRDAPARRLSFDVSRVKGQREPIQVVPRITIRPEPDGSGRFLYGGEPAALKRDFREKLRKEICE